MTCVVGLKHNGMVYIGGDSAGVSGLDVSIRKDPKVFINGNMAFGYTSSFRMGQLLRYSIKIPKQHPDIEDYQYMCTDFIEEIIRCFKHHGYAKIDNNETLGGTFIVGYKGRLYCIDSDFQVAENEEDFCSCGCGESYALGALKALEKYDFRPENRIKKVLSIVTHFSGGVRPPYNIVSI